MPMVCRVIAHFSKTHTRGRHNEAQRPLRHVLPAEGPVPFLLPASPAFQDRGRPSDGGELFGVAGAAPRTRVAPKARGLLRLRPGGCRDAEDEG